MNTDNWFPFIQFRPYFSAQDNKWIRGSFSIPVIMTSCALASCYHSTFAFAFRPTFNVKVPLSSQNNLEFPHLSVFTIHLVFFNFLKLHRSSYNCDFTLSRCSNSRLRQTHNFEFIFISLNTPPTPPLWIGRFLDFTANVLLAPVVRIQSQPLFSTHPNSYSLNLMIFTLVTRQ